MPPRRQPANLTTRRWAAVACAWLLAGFVHAATPPPDPRVAPAELGKLDIKPAPPGRLPWVVFDERSGLPQHTVVDLLEDRRGFVWAATQDGPARYTGHGWETVPLPASMRSNYARVMRVAHDGGLWVGSFDGGLAHLRDGQWTTWSTAQGLPSNRIRGLREVPGPRGVALWIATDAGLARLEDGKLTAYGLESGLPSLDTEALLVADDGTGARTLHVGTSNGLAKRVGDRFELVPVPKELIGHRIDDLVESTGLRGKPALWVASYGAGMAVREDDRWTLLDTRSGLPSNVEVFTASLAADGTPALWIGTEGGLLRFEHGRFTLFDERSGLPIRIVWKVLETATPGGLRTLWLGTWGGGVVRLAPNAWKAFDSGTGLPGGAVTSMLLSEDELGRDVVWAGTSDGELARAIDGRFEAVPLPDWMRHAILFSMLETRAADGTRTLWVASFGSGVGKFEDGQWSRLDPALVPNPRIYQLLHTRGDDGGDVLWIASEGGVGRIEGGALKTYGIADGLPSDMVTQLLEVANADGSRTMWAGTTRGIARLVDGKWVVVGEPGVPGRNIASLQLTTDPDGTRWLWVGSFSRGASRLRVDDPDAEWENFSTRSQPALPSDTVASVAEDRGGRIYLCTTRGVARLTPRAQAAQGARFTAELFTIEDGLPSGDCQQGARLVDARGRVWMGTARGLAMFDPRLEQVDDAPKRLVIDRAELADGSLSLRGGESLSHDQRNLRFSAALLAYDGESRVRYRYQLDGFDDAPTPWQVEHAKEYTNLGAGKYRFLVWGRDARGNVSGPVALPFTVEPAPWRTPLAWAAYAALAALAAWAVMQFRLRALAARTRELEHEVAARTRDLVAARDELARLATEDALTGIANRRRFDEALAREWRHAQREGTLLTLALLDVDWFKKFNDRYGHAAGDACLRAVARAVAAQCARPADLAARYGGEEFALVLPDIDGDGARRLLRAVLASVDALGIAHFDSDCAPHVTVSMGAATLRPMPADDAEQAMATVDALLYAAKAAGRHRALHADLDGTRHEVRGGTAAPDARAG